MKCLRSDAEAPVAECWCATCSAARVVTSRAPQRGIEDGTLLPMFTTAADGTRVYRQIDDELLAAFEVDARYSTVNTSQAPLLSIGMMVARIRTAETDLAMVVGFNEHHKAEMMRLMREREVSVNDVAVLSERCAAQTRRLIDAEEHHSEHHTLQAEQLEKLEAIANQRDMLARELCAAVDHAWVEERRGEPVTQFLCCRRCGRVGDRL